MIRYAGVLVAATTLLLALPPRTPAEPVPDGPRLAVILEAPLYPTQLITMAPDGSERRGLAADSSDHTTRVQGFQPSWSPDGERLAYAGAAGENSPVVFVVEADGSGRKLLHDSWTFSQPLFLPNGHEVAYSTLIVVSGHFERTTRDEPLRLKTATLAIDVDSGKRRQLTPWQHFTPKRVGTFFEPTSFSSDGRSVAGTADGPFYGKRAIVMDRQGPVRLLARGAMEPVYSPDGDSIAFVRRRWGAKRGLGRKVTSSLWVAAAGGRKAKRIIRTRGAIYSPSWDPSSQRLAFVRSGPVPPYSGPMVLMQINADGSCRKVTLRRKALGLGGIAWQPGPGREAGRIVC